MRKLLLIGSVGYSDAETVFRTVAGTLGDLAPRLPDGEVPPRNHWMMWQRDVFARSPDFEIDSTREVVFGGEHRVFEKFRLRADVDPTGLRIGALGYASEAAKSYAIFRRLRKEGVIPQTTRFQMSLPSAVAVCTQHIAPQDQARVEPHYEAALKREVAMMLESIPAEDLAIQWDICQEVLAIEGAWAVPYTDLMGGSIERLARLASFVPEPCELGFHFCYGDPGHKHIKEPGNLRVCVELANGVCGESARPVNWIHMPIPRERTDEDYVRPLTALNIGSTELYLGLIHLTDGIQGARTRIRAAQAFRSAFGLATECGFGRRPPATIPVLLELHKEVAQI